MGIASHVVKKWRFVVSIMSLRIHRWKCRLGVQQIYLVVITWLIRVIVELHMIPFIVMVHAILKVHCSLVAAARCSKGVGPCSAWPAETGQMRGYRISMRMLLKIRMLKESTHRTVVVVGH
jgi:hypothetical protein